MNDDLIQLASAYLDGDVTPAERAQVDASPELLGEVERLRQVRAVLGGNENPPISTRERHLAAALDAWDRLPSTERSSVGPDATPADAAAAAGAASVTAPTPLSDRRKRKAGRSSSGWMLTAAAGLVIVLGAGLVVRGISGGEDDSSTFSASEAPEAASDQLSGSVAVAEEAAEEQFSDDAIETAEAPAGEVAEDLSRIADAEVGADSAPEDDPETLESFDDLAVFAADVLDVPSAERVTSLDATAGVESEASDETAGESAAEPDAEPTNEGDTDLALAAEPVPPIETVAPAFSNCGLVDIVVGPALWNVDGGLFVEDTFVIVGIDTTSNEAVAYNEDGCVEIARTALPTP